MNGRERHVRRARGRGVALGSDLRLRGRWRGAQARGGTPGAAAGRLPEIAVPRLGTAGDLRKRRSSGQIFSWGTDKVNSGDRFQLLPLDFRVGLLEDRA